MHHERFPYSRESPVSPHDFRSSQKTPFREGSYFVVGSTEDLATRERPWAYGKCFDTPGSLTSCWFSCLFYGFHWVSGRPSHRPCFLFSFEVAVSTCRHASMPRYIFAIWRTPACRKCSSRRRRCFGRRDEAVPGPVDGLPAGVATHPGPGVDRSGSNLKNGVGTCEICRNPRRPFFKLQSAGLYGFAVQM